MTTMEARVSTQAKRTPRPAPVKSANTKSGAKTSSEKTEDNAKAREHPHAAPVTKHDRVLSLLNQREGATIPEIMAATGWQQHSVRGFMAGTVKKKLGFALTSSKTAGDLRRYRIDTKRGR